MNDLTAQFMIQALECLDKFLKKKVRLIVGGGGAMVLAHQFRLSTSDIDAVPASGLSIEELDPFVKKVSEKLKISPDWLNTYYSTFSHVLPRDYGTRLITVLELENLKVDALGKDDLLIMKCFAARQKDVVHARALVKKGARIDFVKSHLEYLKKNRLPGSDKALKFLHEIETFFEERE